MKSMAYPTGAVSFLLLYNLFFFNFKVKFNRKSFTFSFYVFSKASNKKKIVPGASKNQEIN